MAVPVPVPYEINYAKILGFHSLAGAIVFAVLYLLLFLWFFRQSLARPTSVHFVLTFFCTLRVIAFVIRAVLAGSAAAGKNLGLVIADEILFGVGYFGLLYSAYTLVLDIELLSESRPPTARLLLLFKNRHVFRLTMIIAVAIGIVSATLNNGQGKPATTLYKVSIAIFLVLTILQVFQTIRLARMEYSGMFSTSLSLRLALRF